MDSISVQRIGLLHPKLRAEALIILQEIEATLAGRAHCRIVSTLRTFAEQDALYAQGRSKPGFIVTNAKAGQSNHNFGTSLDFALIVDKDGDGKFESTSWDTKGDYDGDKKVDWMEVVAIFKKHGWSWGGDWKTLVDMPHVENSFGYSVKQLNARHQAGKVDKQGYVLL